MFICTGYNYKLQEQLVKWIRLNTQLYNAFQIHNSQNSWNLLAMKYWFIAVWLF